MTLALLCTLVQATWADNVSYIYYTVNGDGKTVTKHEDGTANDPTVLTSGLISGNTEDRLYDGWYVLNSSFSYAERIVIYGDVKLILKDGCTLTAEQGIRINTDATLTIYAQSEGDGMGKLVATEAHHDKAAIGGNKNYEAGRLVIHGGEIEAKCKDGSKYAAGIGGGYGDGSGMKEITIYGGKVTAKGAECGAGIGGGKNNNHPGTITIYGGTVMAEAGKNGAGIGGGEYRDGWPITINGGTVSAESFEMGAGIGGGYLGSGTSVVINGGLVHANGSAYGAGIGGGCGQYHSAGDYALAVVTISAYFPTSKKGGDSGTIAIHGGNVFAEGNSYNWTCSASIGGGFWGDVNGPITIDGGEVRAHSKGLNDYISPAIGAGFNGNCYGDITITGTANVYLYSVDAGEFGASLENNTAHYLIGLSSDRDMAFDGTLDLSGMRVTRATTEREEKIVAANRVSVCKDEKSLWMRIMPCDHSDLTYSYINESGHTAHCKYCEYTKNEEHSILAPSTTCEKCGYGEGSTICTLSFPQTSTAEVSGYATAGFQAVQGQIITIPSCTYVPEGWKFVGWLRQSSNSAPSSIEAADSETSLLQPGDEYTVTGNEIFFARYCYDFVETWMWDATLSNASLTIKAGSDDAINVTPVTVSDRTEIAATDAADGSITATATATYTHGSTTYTFSSTQTKVLSYSLSLGEDDNTEALTTYKGRSMNVTLTGRTLYKDGNWNTLCLPFSVGDGDDTDDVTYSGSPLAGATVKELADASVADGTLTLTFADATRIEAGRAYLVKWDSGSDLTPSDLVFTGVTLAKDLSDDAISTDDSGTATVTFMGTYKQLSYDADDRTVLFLGANNTLYYPQSGATIGAQRAYFKLSGITAGDKGTGVRTFVLNFGDGDTTTGIIEAEANSSFFTLHSSFKEGWYALDGRRLSGKPAQKGIYINNGKKIVIK